MQFKESQIAAYEEKCEEYMRKTNLYMALLVVSGIVIGVGALYLNTVGLASWREFFVLLAVGAAALCFYIVSILRRHIIQSGILLEEFIYELQKVLARTHLDLEDMKSRIVTVETNFLANDHELYTKKFIWRPFLAYLERKARGIKDEEPEFIDVPVVWMNENPLELDIRDTNFVQLNWEIKRGIRQLYFANYEQKHDILTQLGNLASTNRIVYERFLRNQKVSKLLKLYKKQVRAWYLSPAAKLKLIYFVDSVLQNRPYREDCDEMEQLLHDKNSQIQQYVQDFWRVHRRSLKFYGLEATWLLLIVPVIGASLWTLERFGVFLGTMVFFIGSAVVVYGEMALVTRQLRDLKSKKLVPILIASLMGIRHSMCSEAGSDPALAKKYQRHFKEAEKHFILKVTEVEAIRYAKENVKAKVLANLSGSALALQERKEEQLRGYYEQFHHYRRQCLKYGALEAFVGLLIIPAYALSFLVGESLGLDLAGDLLEDVLIWGIALLTEAVLFMRHVRVSRRKELYLLIYQKMTVMLGDDRAFLDEARLALELQRLEASIVEAAELDDMHDVSAYVKSCMGA